MVGRNDGKASSQAGNFFIVSTTSNYTDWFIVPLPSKLAGIVGPWAHDTGRRRDMWVCRHALCLTITLVGGCEPGDFLIFLVVETSSHLSPNQRTQSPIDSIHLASKRLKYNFN